ncbi:MAG: hypothetical protein V4726_22655 [Verrucomicrobiota bacterium]
MNRLSGTLISRINFEERRVDAARIAAVRSAVLDFPLEEVKAAAALPDGETGGLIGGVLYSRWAELEPDAALTAALASAERTISQEALLGALSVRALKDPAGAVLWAWEHAPENLEEYEPGERRKELIRSLLEPLMASDPQAYLHLMTSPALEASNIQSRRRTFASALPCAPAAALEGLLTEEKRGSLQGNFEFRDYVDMETLQPTEAETMASFAADLPEDSALRRECLRTAVQVFARADPSRAADLTVSARPSEPEREEEWRTHTGGLLRNWKESDPAAAARWLTTNTELDPDALSDLARFAGFPAPSLTIPNPPAAP